MQLGTVVNELLHPDWRFVESDLHNIHERVQEYDGEARLARDNDSGQLGLVRRISNPVGGGHIWAVARRLRDPETNDPLEGEPDARVLTEQRESDAFRIGNLASWIRQQNRVWEYNQELTALRDREAQMEKAEQFVWLAGRDGPNRRVAPVSFSSGIPATNG